MWHSSIYGLSSRLNRARRWKDNLEKEASLRHYGYDLYSFLFLLTLKCNKRTFNFYHYIRCHKCSEYPIFQIQCIPHRDLNAYQNLIADSLAIFVIEINFCSHANVCSWIIGEELPFRDFQFEIFQLFWKRLHDECNIQLTSELFYLEYAMCLRTRCVCQSECPKQQTTRQNLCFGSIHTGNTLNGIFSRYFPFWFPDKANKVDELVGRRRDREGVKERKKRRKGKYSWLTAERLFREDPFVSTFWYIHICICEQRWWKKRNTYITYLRRKWTKKASNTLLLI